MINPELRRKIKVRMRPDLIITKQKHAGQSYYIVKDPISLKYYRFREEELFLLRQFDGQNTLDDIRHEFVEHFRPQRISVTDIEKFVQQLLQAGIATADTPQIGQRLFERYKKKRSDKLKQALMNLLYIKVPIFDPEKLLGGLLPYTYYFFTIPFFLVMVALWISAGLLVLANWNTFISKLPTYHEFFTWRNLLYFWVTLGVVKVIHEFGHGISCKRFGGEVHEMGILMLVLTPCLYCNVSDSWMLPNKWHRAIIGAAGIYVELILASIFVWVWWYTEPGLLNTLALSIVFICSVSTVIFNGNPLLRFDGYYILSDLLEIPNLREHANKYLGNQAAKLFFGSEVVEDPFLPKQHRLFFIFFAVAAYVYRWVVTIGILYFLYSFLKPYKLGSISAMLATASLFTMFVMPLNNVIKTLRNRWRSMKVSKVRMAVSFSTAILILAAILFTPFPMRIDAPMIVQPREPTTVFVQESGILDQLFFRDGDTVTSGSVLAVLKNTELDMEIEKARLDHDMYARAALSYLAGGDETNARVNQLKASAANRQMQQLSSQREKLEIRVPPGVHGTVFAPPKERELGKFLQMGEPFCQIGESNELEAFIVIEHSDISLINSGKQIAWIKLYGHVGKIIKGQIQRVSTTEVVDLPQALSNKVGGEVATTTDPDRKIEVPLMKSYGLQVPLDNSDGALTSGVRGIARIDIGYHSLFWRLKRYFQQTFHFKM